MWRGTTHETSSETRRGGELRHLDDAFSAEGTFQNADLLRVRLNGVMIRERRDRFRPPGRRDNDLIVKTRYRFGNEPPVERLHYLKKEQALGWHGDFFDDVVLSIPDLQHDRLHLRVQVYDLDGVSTDLVDTIEKFSESAAVLFPQLATYAGIATLGADQLVNLVNNIDQHDEILDEKVTFEINEPRTRHKLLQPGYFVCFRDEPVDGHLELRDDCRVLQNGDEYTDASYAVLEFEKDHDDDSKREIDQRVAKLVAELNGKRRSSEPALHFLRETLGVYSQYKKLERLRELERKRQPRKRLTRREKELRAELEADPILEPCIGDADDES